MKAMTNKKELKRLLEAAEREMTAVGRLPESVARLQAVGAIRQFKAGEPVGFDRRYDGQARAVFGPAICRSFVTCADILSARRSIKHARRGVIPMPAYDDSGMLGSVLEPMIAV